MRRHQEPQTLHFLITGAQLHGNLGSAAMSIVTIRALKSLLPDARISFVSKYFEGEQENLSRFFDSNPDVHLIKTTQARATFFDLPLSALASLLRAPGFASHLSPLLNAFQSADMVIDIGGITFSEERGLTGLIINATWVLFPILTGRPIAKLSQAFGHIRHRWFRAISRFLLKRVSLLIARGSLSFRELTQLNLDQKTWECADLAFLLEPEQTARTQGIEKPDDALVLGIAPSSVMYHKRGETSYIDLVATLIERLLESYADATIWILAHSYREGDTLSNNDGPICRWIYNSLTEHHRSRVHLIVGDYTPGEMRTIIGKTDAFLAYRFHAMVSALAMATPVVANGWSHKYKEVQSQFSLGYALGQNATAESILTVIDEMISHHDKIRERIQSRLPTVRESARRNFTLLSEFLEREGLI